MARAGYRIFDADTHIIEPVEPIEAYLAAADRAKLAALGPAARAPAKGGMSRYQMASAPPSTDAWARGSASCLRAPPRVA